MYDKRSHGDKSMKQPEYGMISHNNKKRSEKAAQASKIQQRSFYLYKKITL